MNLGILLWNTCNAECAHCAVNSGPSESPVLSDEQIFKAIDAAFYNEAQPSIGLSGGEAFAFFDRLCRIVSYAVEKGAKISINTNGFWGTTVDNAREKVVVLKNLGVRQLIVSMDDFHGDYIAAERPVNVVRACKIEHLEVEVQFVAAKGKSRLSDLLARYGDDLLNVRCREIPCHPVGRASEHVPADQLFTTASLPSGLCPSLVMSISAAGDVIPCCNTAGHLPSLRIGHVDDDLTELNEKFTNGALASILATRGPIALVPKLEQTGFRPRAAGYVDQCHLCFDIFRDPIVALRAKRVARNLFAGDFLPLACAEFESASSIGDSEVGNTPR